MAPAARIWVAIVGSTAVMATSIGCGDDDVGPRAAEDSGIVDAPAADSGADDDAAVDGGGDAEVDAGPPPGVPDRYCPGGEGCDGDGDGVLRVGAAAVDISPTIDETTEVQTVDVDGNGQYDPGDGDEFADRDGDGAFDGVWMVNSNGRGASSVHDPLWARAIVLSRGETTLALVAVDLYGYFVDQVDAIRESLADTGIDHVLVASTHTHSARDVLGFNGPSAIEYGVDPAYNAFLRTAIARAVRDALAAVRPAHVQYAALQLRDQPGGTSRYVSDLRPPIVIDDEVRVMRFVDAADDAVTVATLVNWAQHPEAWPGNSQALSSDMFHWLRTGIEDGAVASDGASLPGVGGIAVVFQGASGGNLGPLDVAAVEWDGTPVEGRQSERKAEVLGSQVASFVLRALGPGGGSVTDETAEIGFRTRRFLVKLQNRFFQVALLAGLFGTERPTFAWDDMRAILPGRNEPSLRTEVSVIDVGRASIATVPGELDPDLFVGGYDGSHTPEGIDINPPMPNAPDLDDAPPPPYLRDLLLEREGAEHAFLFALANDQIGYLIPEFNYVLHPTAPYVREAEGEHYDETYSIGIDGWPTVRAQLEPLIRWRPAARGD